ncbi:oxidoreductase [Streptomyces sp. CC224B]|uniref:WD40/YVTN/BNR-like repeat-containing protein n=1 Tax=Streptomyces sp. CC224B TaxID=3044571 RepID=UPI0024A83A6D|nr:oxidoreductase [Streptomyces sp. CC224B]
MRRMGQADFRGRVVRTVRKPGRSAERRTGRGATGRARVLGALALGVTALAATVLAAPGAVAAPAASPDATGRSGTARGAAWSGAGSGSEGGHGAGWDLKDTGTDARFRGLAAVSRTTAWAAGSRGTVLRTADGGRSWRDVSPPGAAGLEFRDVEAFDGRRAVVLAIGEGEASRVYRTTDGGATWTEAFRNPDPKAFYDCMTFFDRRHGLAVSDPVDGKYRMLSTADGGRSWKVLPNQGMPAAQDKEAAFAASGQCLVSTGPRDAWLATGGAARARVLHSADRGLTWTVADAPIPAGDPARGVFGLAFRDRAHGLAVGGDYRPGQPSPTASAVTRDGGRTWRPSARPAPAYRSGVAWLPHSRTTALAVGPTGTDLTTDAGRTWRTVDDGSYDTVDCARDFGCWAAGEKGRVARLEPR